MQQVGATWSTSNLQRSTVQSGPIAAALSGAVGLALAIGANRAPPSTASIALLFGAPVMLGMLLWWLLRTRALLAAMLLTLLSYAYLPSGWDALSVGFPRSVLRVTDYGLSWALSAFLLQLVVTAVAGLGERSNLAARQTRRLLELVTPTRRGDAIVIGVFAFLLVAFVGAVRDGQWSFYAPGAQRFDEMKLAGGIRVALMYPPALLACSAVVGAKLSQAKVWDDTTRRNRWLAVAFVVIGLVFAAQARRLMLASFAMLILPQIAAGGRLVSVPLRRLLTTLALTGGLLVGMLYGSNLWRASLRHRTQSTVAHVQQMAQVTVSADEAINSLRSRLTYLWMDAAIMELHAHRAYSPLIEHAFVTELVISTPGMFFPDKYRFPRMSCETVIGAGHSLSDDLPCTPIAEGVLYGGLTGLVTVLAGWGLAVWLGSLLYGTGTDLGLALAAFAMGPLTAIEGGAFPIVQCVRGAITGAVFILPLAWLASLGLSWVERARWR